MNYGFITGSVIFAIVIGLITNNVMGSFEGFALDSKSKVKALLNAIEFDDVNGSRIMRMTTPLYVENKILLEGGSILMKPKDKSFSLYFKDNGELVHKSDTGASTSMLMFGVAEYKGPKFVNVATKERGASVKVSGIWPYRSHRFRPEYLIDPDLNKFVHSRTTNAPWNDIYLNRSYPIHKISLTNVHAPDRLQTPKLEIYNGNKVVHTVVMNVKGARDFSMNVPEIVGNRVRIINPNNHLHLGNLKIFTKE